MTTKTQARAKQVAKVLLEIGAVGFALEKPITFKSGILSPVYIDNRQLPFHPHAWEVVLQALVSIADEKKFDVIAGIETAGIPHSATLGYLLKKPSVFVRKQVKDHGTKSRVEGGKVEGKRVLLIEDHVSTGGSSLAGVTALRESGAEVKECLAITSYDFPEAQEQFAKAQVKLITLTNFRAITQVAQDEKLISSAQLQTILDWSNNPHEWQPERN